MRLSLFLSVLLLVGCAESSDAPIEADPSTETTMDDGASGVPGDLSALGSDTVEFPGDDGTREQRFEAGQAHTHDAGDHTVENEGAAVAEFLVVEVKR
ncbi:MAG: hypothetical protein AAGI52_07805 [Bacteroidota bacterium]